MSNEIEMKQIGNGFATYYYLTTTCEVYSARSKKIIKPKRNTYKLRTEDKSYEHISKKGLYRLVFDKVWCIDEIENLNGEEWRAIPQTGNIYFCSNKGRIKSLVGYNAIILKTDRNGSDYERVEIKQNGKVVRKLISHIVAETWLEKPKDGKEYVVHHKDRQPIEELGGKS